MAQDEFGGTLVDDSSPTPTPSLPAIEPAVPRRATGPIQTDEFGGKVVSTLPTLETFDPVEDLLTKRQDVRKSRLFMRQQIKGETGQEMTPQDFADVEGEVDLVHPASANLKHLEAQRASSGVYDPKMTAPFWERLQQALNYEAGPAALTGLVRLAQFSNFANPAVYIAQAVSGNPSNAALEKWKDSVILHDYQPPPEQQEVPVGGFGVRPQGPQGYGHWTGPTATGGSLGVVALSTLLSGGAAEIAGAAPPVVRTIGTLGGIILSHFGVEKDIKQKLLSQRDAAGKPVYTEDQASNRALGVSLATLPISYFSAREFMPVAKWLDGNSYAGSMFSSALEGAANNALGNTITGASIQAGQVVVGAQKSIGDAISAVFNDAGSGFLIGGIQATGLNLVNRALGRMTQQRTFWDLYHKDLDIFGPRELYQKLTGPEFKASDTDANTTVQFWDRMVKHGVELGYYDDTESGWKSMFARQSEQENYGLAQSILFQNRSTIEGFYSKTREMVLDLPQEKMTADQASATLRNGGAKLDELEWTGLAGYLQNAKENNRQVTRSDLAKFMDQNQVKLSVVKKTETGDPVPLEEFEQIFHAYEESEANWNKATQKQTRNSNPDLVEQVASEERAAKREYDTAREAYLKASRQGQYQTRYEFATPTGPKSNYEEWLIRLPQGPEFHPDLIPPGPDNGEKVLHQSSHWEEPNVLVHIRTDERIDPRTGKRYLNVNEIQRDWKPPKPGTDEKPGPFENTWIDLGLKKILIEAVSRGYDTVAWQPGYMQDKFQGGPSVERTKIYDELVPSKLMALARGLDKDAKFTRVQLHEGGSLPPVEIPAIGITPKMRDAVLQGLPLFQPAKKSKATGPERFGDSLLTGNQARAMMMVLQNGRAIIRGLKNADVESGLHELFHVARKSLLRGEDLDLAEQLFGVKDHAWLPKNEEAFVKEFLSYARDGKSPDPRYQPFMSRISKVLTRIYKQADVNLPSPSHEMSGIFDRLIAADTDPIRTKRLEVIKSTGELATAEKSLDRLRREVRKEELTGEPKEKYLVLLAEESKVRDQKIAHSRLLQELQDAKEGFRDDTDPIYQEERAKRKLFDAEAEKYIPYENFQPIRDGLSKTWREFRSYLSSSAATLGNNRFTYNLKTFLHQVEVRRRAQIGKWEPGINEFAHKMGTEGWQWLMDAKDTGFSRFRRMLDETGVPKELKLSPEELQQAEKFKDYKNLTYYAMDDIAKGGKELNILRQLASGTKVFAEQSLQYPLPRLMTRDGFEFLTRNSVELRRYLTKVAKLNGIDLETALATWTKEVSEIKNRTSGMLEFSRTFKYMPDVHVLENGQVFNVLHNHPVDAFRAMVTRGYSRLEWVRFAGQGLMPNVHMNRGFMEDVLGAAEQTRRPVGKPEITGILESMGMDRNEAKGMSMTEQQLWLTVNGIPYAESPSEVHDRMMALSPRDFNTPAKEANLRKLAKEIAGVDDLAPLPTILQGVKDRVMQDTEDHVLEKLKLEYRRQDGDVTALERHLMDAQGIPRSVSEDTALHRTWLFGNQLQSFLNLSLAPPKNIVQTHASTLVYAGFMDSLRGLRDAFRNPAEAREALAQLGAYQYPLRTYAGDSSYGLTRASKYIRDVGGLIFGHDAAHDYIQVVSGMTGQRLADRWSKPGGFRDRDIPVARGILKLDASEIASLKAGKMTDQIRSGIVQALQNKAMGGTKTALNEKSVIELNPNVNMLFKYINFVFESQRSIDAMVGEFTSAIKAKDTERVKGATALIVRYLSVSTGVGMTMALAGEAIRHKPLPKDPEEWGAMLKQGLFETATFGVIGQITSSFTRTGAPTQGSELMISNWPAVAAVADFYNVALGYGRYGDFGPARRGWEFLKVQTPVLRAFVNSINDMRYPDRKVYEEVRRNWFSWQGKQPGQDDKEREPGQIESDYDDVWNALASNDQRWAMLAARDYYKMMTQRGIAPSVARTNLRSSLANRRPLPSNDDNVFKFLMTRPLEERRRFSTVDFQYRSLMNQVAPSEE